MNKAIEQIELVKSITKLYTIECDKIELCKSLIDMGYNAYLKYPISDWESFSGLTSIGVSDIYIDSPLCFQHDKILVAKEKNNIKIRVSPTISSNGTLISEKPKTFFIRPEDLNLYTYIDVIDFKYNQQEQEDALFRIYTRGSFNFDIDQLIGSLPRVNNILFKEDFAKSRLNCGQVCHVPSRTCNFCTTYFALLKRVPRIVELKKVAD